MDTDFVIQNGQILTTEAVFQQVEARLSFICPDGVCCGRISASCQADLCGTQPERLFGLYSQKGCLQVGSDADMVIFDPRVSFHLAAQSTLEGFSLYKVVDYTPYEGRKVKGWPVTVFLRSAPIVVNRQPVSLRSLGVFLPRYFGRTAEKKNRHKQKEVMFTKRISSSSTLRLLQPSQIFHTTSTPIQIFERSKKPCLKSSFCAGLC